MKSIAAISLISGLAAAQKTVPNVPVDAQVGLISFPLFCNVQALGDKTFSTSFTATAPNYGASGQQIYYNEIAATVIIPKSVTSYAGAVGATQASALVKLNLNLDNASPSTLTVFPNGLLLQNLTVNPNDVLPVHIPKSGVLSPVGPVTLGTAGTDHVIHLGDVNVQVNLQDAKGNQKLGPLAITCGKQPVTFNLGVVNVGPKTGAAAFTPSAGGSNTYPSITNGEDTGFFRYPYSCNFGGAVGTQAVDLTIGGTIPGYLAPSQKFYLDDAQAFLRVPAAANQAAKKAYPNLASYQFSVTAFNIKTQNASPATLNVLSSPISVNQAYNANGFVLSLPQSSTLRAGPITAGSAGSNALLSSGSAAASLNYLDSAGKTLGSTTVSCAPVKAADLIGVPVTTSTPAPISS